MMEEKMEGRKKIDQLLTHFIMYSNCYSIWDFCECECLL